MAFLSHTIPWETIVSKLEYKAARTGPGPQHARISLSNTPKQISQLEYFAQKFQVAVHQHAVDERRKFRSRQAYTTRATNWTSSSIDAKDSESLPNVITANIAGSGIDEDSRRIRRNAELRQMQRLMKETGWSDDVENRMVYQPDLVDKYFNAYDLSSGRRSHMHFLNSRTGSRIEEWVEWFGVGTADSESKIVHDWRSRAYRDRQSKQYQLNDVLKLLITESVSADANRQRYTTDTLLLLAHHPKLKLEEFLGLGMDCCNIFCGFENIATYALKLFLLLNLVAGMQDRGIKEISAPSQTLVVFEKNVANEVASAQQWICPGPRPHIILLPRPNYMNLNAWHGVVKQVCREHDDLAETILPCMILFPLSTNEKEGQKRVYMEIDLLADYVVLKNGLKALWRTLVIVEMITRELGRPFNWEQQVLDMLNELNIWPSHEQSWYEYETTRRGYPIVAGGSSPDRYLFSRSARPLPVDQAWHALGCLV